MSWIELDLNQECRTWEIELDVSSTIMSRVYIYFLQIMLVCQQHRSLH